MGRRATSRVLVGRRAELGELSAALDAATTGAGGLVLVDGEAGIGKSRLIDEFAASARDHGAGVLAGSCLPFADAVPYAPFVQILGHLSAGESGAGGVPAAADPTDRFRFFAWVADHLVAASQTHPLVVVVEDLQWADESTGDLLLFVANAVRSAPVVVVASRRPPERDRATGLSVALGELVRSGRARHVILGPLEPLEVGELIGHLTGSAPPPGLFDPVADRADGNPFFVEELVAAGGGPDLPTTIGDLILQRVAGIDAPTQRLLQITAVIGRRVGYPLLRDVTDLDSVALDAALRDAVGRQLMIRTGELYSFRHALGREAVYGDLLPGERAARHERVAVALTGHPELAVGEDPALTAAELAHHWHAAGRITESLTASVQAGRAAEVAHAPIEAQAHYSRALELWPRVTDAEAVAGTDRLWLLEHAAEVASLAGSHHGALQLADQLVAELDPAHEPERHARILDRRALYSWHAGDLATSKQATEALREGVESGVTLAVVTRLCGVAYQAALELRYLDALALARDALAAAHQAQGRAEVSYALHVLGSLEGHLGRYDDGIERLHESLDLAMQSDDAERIGSTWHNLVEAFVFAGRAAEAVDLAERGLVDLERRGLHRTYAALTTGQLVLALVALGRWAEADVVSARLLAGDVDPYFALPVKFGRLHVLVRQGRFADAEALLAELGASFGAYDYTAGVCAAWEAELAIWQRDWQRARTALTRADAITAATDEVLLELRLTALAVRLEADEFDWLRTSAQPPDKQDVGRTADARIHRAEAFLERIERAIDTASQPFRRILELARAERSRLDDPPPAAPWAAISDSAGPDIYLVAYARWRQAEALLADDVRTGRSSAAQLLGDALTAATELGAEPLAGAVSDLARRAGVARPVAADGDRGEEPEEALAAHGLTPRELEVLRLLGEGRSNREIGEALFISAKTASVHVTHILQKLNVTTRVQAAVAAHRLAPPPD
jgi:DNA-binding CsgD family transcriptional regulator/tetratricopeptide (TPR) repeat protein